MIDFLPLNLSLSLNLPQMLADFFSSLLEGEAGLTL
jgi:hypothetical protein